MKHQECDISIHALREEGDLDDDVARLGVGEISIHALREEGDQLSGFFYDSHHKFLSTPSARRATPNAGQYNRKQLISIHALREEGDRTSKFSQLNINRFLSTPSARRATQA